MKSKIEPSPWFGLFEIPITMKVPFDVYIQTY